MNTLVDWLLSLTPHGAPFFDTYAWLINTAIYTTVTALLIILFKLIFKNRIKARWHFLIWGILLIRLVVPVLPSTPISVFNAVRVEESVIEQSSYQAEIIIPEEGKESDNIPIIKSQTELDSATHIPQGNVSIINIDRIVVFVWLGGTLILLGYFAVVFVVFTHRLKKRRDKVDDITLNILLSCKSKLNINKNVNLYFADTTPMLIGLFKPSIYIPDNLNPEELKSVLIHELCHLKHLDILWSAVAAAVLCLNWYNPVIWVSFFMFKRDIELYCDERTLKFTGNRQSYAKLLLKTAKKNRYVLGTSSLQSGKSDVKRRIRYLAKFKKPTVIIIIAAVLTAAIITTICLTNSTGSPVKTESSDLNIYEVNLYTVTKYSGNEKVWSTEIFEESDATPDSRGTEFPSIQTNGNDKIRLFFGEVYSTTYRVDEKDQRIGYITAVDAENGSILFSKKFEEYADYNNTDEETDYSSFVSAALVRGDGNIDVFHVQSSYTEGFEPHYETTLITLNQNGETLNQSKFNTGEIRFFDSVCETDDGYAVCGYDKKHNPDFMVAKAENNNVYSQITINTYEEKSDANHITWHFDDTNLWSIDGKVYLTMTKENTNITGKYAAYDVTDNPDYSNILQDEKDGNFAVLYTVDFDNYKAEPFEIGESLSGNELFTDERGNIYYSVFKITAESADFMPIYDEPIENTEYWIYVFDRDGKPIDNYSTNTPAKTYLPFEVIN